jgi:Na+-transporting methylmalonyl-CoA/oxaloacetate decarboxylase gamma subunit
MSNLLITALEITALGMGLVFAAIMLLWLMMFLLASLTAEKTNASDSPAADSVMDSDSKARAAAVAVAFALAQEQATTARPLTDPPTALVSAWQLGMRTKQLYQKGEPIKRQPRKIG